MSKQAWAQAVELFSEGVRFVQFPSPILHLFWFQITYFVPYFIVLSWSIVKMPPKKKAKKESPAVQKVKITIPSDKQHWGRNLPEEHGELAFYNHFFFKFLQSQAPFSSWCKCKIPPNV